MAEIRPLERDDMPKVASMLHADLTAATPEEEIIRSITGTMIDGPWGDSELPSLVATEDGEVIGFIGSQPRRFRLGDKVLRGVCISHLTVASGRRGGAAGALLLRRMLNSGQDLTFSDTANDEVARIWKVLGGQLDHARACDWAMVLRPGGWLRAVGRRVVLRRRASDVPLGNLAIGSLRRRDGAAVAVSPAVGVESAEASPAEIAELLPEIGRGYEIRAEYDESFLTHVFAEMEAQFGTVVRRLVRVGGRPAGWYAYVPDLRGVSRVLHLMPAERHGDAVFGELVGDVRGRGGSVLVGRLEPHLTAILEPRQPALAFARRPMIHARDTAVLAAMASSSSLLTQLDGEWFVL